MPWMNASISSVLATWISCWYTGQALPSRLPPTYPHAKLSFHSCFSPQPFALITLDFCYFLHFFRPTCPTPTVLTSVTLISLMVTLPVFAAITLISRFLLTLSGSHNAATLDEDYVRLCDRRGRHSGWLWRAGQRLATLGQLGSATIARHMWRK